MAKTLYLMRHAKSGWTDMSQSDFDRPLNKRGQRDAPEMGRRLKKRDVKPEIILCSPAQRSRQTLEQLIREFGGTMKTVQFDDRIYEADPDTLLDVIRSLPEAFASAMVIGHNPSMGRLANQLSDVRIEQMPTCAVATLELPSSRWKDTGTQTARLLHFDYPKRRPEG
ncbi:MAG TPA: histidine phosphatase family protein [Pontiella sp.]|nr:histidine phosphatase family protein [Pontiella sp.]